MAHQKTHYDEMVHERMEYAFEQLYNKYAKKIKSLLGEIMQNFKTGLYSYNTSSFNYEKWVSCNGSLCKIDNKSIGLTSVKEILPIEIASEILADNFKWKNEFYSAQLSNDGTLLIDNKKVGYFVLQKDKGDVYSHDLGKQFYKMKVNQKPKIIEKSEKHILIKYEGHIKTNGILINAQIILKLDDSETIEWEISLDSQGTGYVFKMIFENEINHQIYAGMPFDLVQREVSDTDLLSKKLEKGLQKVLLGQRDLKNMKQYPFSEFIVSKGTSRTSMLMAKGLKQYEADIEGKIALTIRRSVEWMSKVVSTRVGDAASRFYVPDARCERKVVHKIAYAVVDNSTDPNGYGLINLVNDKFQGQHFIIENNSGGDLSEMLYSLPANPLSSLRLKNKKTVVTYFNSVTKKIVKDEVIQIDKNTTRHTKNPKNKNTTIYNFPKYPVEANKTVPSKEVIKDLKNDTKVFNEQLKLLKLEAKTLDSKKLQRIIHKIYIKEREIAELELCIALNEKKLNESLRKEDYLFKYDKKIGELGLKLNLARINRRIFDHFVEIL